MYTRRAVTSKSTGEHNKKEEEHNILQLTLHMLHNNYRKHDSLGLHCTNETVGGLGEYQADFGCCSPYSMYERKFGPYGLVAASHRVITKSTHLHHALCQ